MSQSIVPKFDPSSAHLLQITMHRLTASLSLQVANAVLKPSRLRFVLEPKPEPEPASEPEPEPKPKPEPEPKLEPEKKPDVDHNRKLPRLAAMRTLFIANGLFMIRASVVDVAVVKSFTVASFVASRASEVALDWVVKDPHMPLLIANQCSTKLPKKMHHIFLSFTNTAHQDDTKRGLFLLLET
jgi:hypothetical protein